MGTCAVPRDASSAAPVAILARVIPSHAIPKRQSRVSARCFPTNSTSAPRLASQATCIEFGDQSAWETVEGGGASHQTPTSVCHASASRHLNTSRITRSKHTNTYHLQSFNIAREKSRLSCPTTKHIAALDRTSKVRNNAPACCEPAAIA